MLNMQEGKGIIWLMFNNSTSNYFLKRPNLHQNTDIYLDIIIIIIIYIYIYKKFQYMSSEHLDYCENIHFPQAS